MSNRKKNRRDFLVCFAVFKLDTSFAYYKTLPSAWSVIVVEYDEKGAKELQAVLGKLEINIDFGFYSRLFWKKIINGVTENDE
ncbi:MAG: hypothetical protein COC24_011775 [Alphaproteobacteria bacterium]|nr:hypothetical protein [Alphaproteobacteria bacterium]